MCNPTIVNEVACRGINIDMYGYTNSCVYTYIHIYIKLDLHPYNNCNTNNYMHMREYDRINARASNTNMHRFTNIHMLTPYNNIHTFAAEHIHTWLWVTHTCTHVCMHVLSTTCTYINE